MASWTTILGPVLGVFAIAVLGVVVRRAGWLDDRAETTLLRLVVRLFIPCLIFPSVATSELLRDPANLIAPPAFGFGSVALGVGLGLVLARLAGPSLGLDTPAKRRTFAVCVGLYNYGYLAIPIVQALHDEATLSVLFVHNLGVELCLWTLCFFVLSGGWRGGWRRLVNPPLLALLAGLGANLTGLTDWVPDWAMDTVRRLGACAIPIGLLLSGIVAGEVWSTRAILAGWRVAVAGIAMALGITPAIVLGIASWVEPSEALARVIVVEAAMPAALLPIVLARHYGGDPPTAIRVVLSTSLASLVTIPLWLHFGSAWLGLAG